MGKEQSPDVTKRMKEREREIVCEVFIHLLYANFEFLHIQYDATLEILHCKT